jgi:hypothetical protein
MTRLGLRREAEAGGEAHRCVGDVLPETGRLTAVRRGRTCAAGSAGIDIP